MSDRPLLVFDTNVLMDVWLVRGTAATMLVELAEQGVIELVMPEYVLFEFSRDPGVKNSGARRCGG